jgi:hypothetical protein
VNAEISRKDNSQIEKATQSRSLDCEYFAAPRAAREFEQVKPAGTNREATVLMFKPGDQERRH